MAFLQLQNYQSLQILLLVVPSQWIQTHHISFRFFWVVHDRQKECCARSLPRENILKIEQIYKNVFLQIMSLLSIRDRKASTAGDSAASFSSWNCPETCPKRACVLSTSKATAFNVESNGFFWGLDNKNTGHFNIFCPEVECFGK